MIRSATSFICERDRGGRGPGCCVSRPEAHRRGQAGPTLICFRTDASRLAHALTRSVRSMSCTALCATDSSVFRTTLRACEHKVLVVDLPPPSPALRALDGPPSGPCLRDHLLDLRP